MLRAGRLVTAPALPVTRVAGGSRQNQLNPRRSYTCLVLRHSGSNSDEKALGASGRGCVLTKRQVYRRAVVECARAETEEVRSCLGGAAEGGHISQGTPARRVECSNCVTNSVGGSHHTLIIRGNSSCFSSPITSAS